MKMRMDWRGRDSVVLSSQKYCEPNHALLKKMEEEEDVIWIASSGTTGAPRWIGLSREAILTSAAAVNAHLRSDFQDIWLHALPDFHIGGLAIDARAWLSGAQVIRVGAVGRGSWDPEEWLEAASFATLSALVPTQVYDLVRIGVKAPPSLRAIIVGGAKIDEDLYFAARSKGWPLLPSYGLTECASQVATASLQSLEKKKFPQLKILPHVQIRQGSHHTLFLSSRSLLTAYMDNHQREDPKQKGWYRTSDRGECREGGLIIFGRSDDIIKVRGEKVDLTEIQERCREIQKQMDLQGEFVIAAKKDRRNGSRIVIVVDREGSVSVPRLLEQYHKESAKFARIDEIKEVDLLEKTALGKEKRDKIFDL